MDESQTRLAVMSKHEVTLSKTVTVVCDNKCLQSNPTLTFWSQINPSLFSFFIKLCG